MKRYWFVPAVLLSVLLLAWCAAACASGVETDEDGGVWDYTNGIYRAPDGSEHPIENTDSGASSSYDVPANSDGSITVESGQYQVDIPVEGEGAHLTEEEWAARRDKYAARNGTTTGTAYTDEDGSVYPAEIVYLGLGRSTIRVDGEELVVPTSSLTWDTEAPEDKRLAVVTLHNNPKLTYLTLRAKKKQGSFVMGNCTKRRVLRVISTGKTWTMVDDDGVRGYVLTSGLTFYDNKPKRYAAGRVTIRGKTTSKDTVHARTSTASDPGYVLSGDGREIVEFAVATPVTVFSRDEKWSELDINGWHCFMLNEFVTLDEPLPEPEEEAAPEADAEPASEGGEGAEPESPAPAEAEPEETAKPVKPAKAPAERPALSPQPVSTDQVELADRPLPPV